MAPACGGRVRVTPCSAQQRGVLRNCQCQHDGNYSSKHVMLSIVNGKKGANRHAASTSQNKRLSALVDPLLNQGCGISPLDAENPAASTGTAKTCRRFATGAGVRAQPRRARERGQAPHREGTGRDGRAHVKTMTVRVSLRRAQTTSPRRLRSGTLRFVSGLPERAVRALFVRHVAWSARRSDAKPRTVGLIAFWNANQSAVNSNPTAAPSCL